MQTFLLYLTLGLGGGAFYACLGVSACLTHRASGVINFAIGSMAMVPAMTYAVLRTRGDLVLPIVGVQARFHLATHVATPVAVLIALVVGVVVFGFGYVVIFHPMRDSPAVTKAVAALAYALVLQGIGQRRYGQRPLRAPSLLPNGLVSMFGGIVPTDRLWFALVAIVLTAACIVYLRWTFAGLVLQATADNEQGVLLLGRSPFRSALTAWTVAGLVSSVGAVLLVSFTSVTVAQFGLWAIPALGAGLAGRFRSLPTVCAVALAIGGLQSLAVHLGADETLPRMLQHGLDDALPLVVIVVALSFSGHALPRRGALLERRHPLASRAPPAWFWAALATTALAATWFGSSALRLSVGQSAITSVLALSLVVSAGFIGQVSLAQVTVAGLCAFILAGLTTGLHVPFPLAPVLAVVAAGSIGFAVGIPAVRIRGAQLMVVSLAFAVAINRLVLENPQIAGFDYTVHVPPARLFGLDLGVFGRGRFPARGAVAMIVLGAVAAGLATSNLRRSSTGRRWLAVRGNERAAAASGVDVVRSKLLASAVAMGLAGAGGVLIAYLTEAVSYRLFDTDTAFELLALAYLAGIASIAGAYLAGAAAAGGLLEHFFGIGAGSQARSLLYGVALLVVTQRSPGGLVEALRRARELLERGGALVLARAPRRAAPLRASASLTTTDDGGPPPSEADLVRPRPEYPR